jgi:hypothetical protein
MWFPEIWSTLLIQRTISKIAGNGRRSGEQLLPQALRANPGTAVRSMAERPSRNVLYSQPAVVFITRSMGDTCRWRQGAPRAAGTGKESGETAYGVLRKGFIVEAEPVL